MLENRFVTAVTVPLTSFWHRLVYERPFSPPQKALILETGTVRDVMLTTPLLGALRRAFPKARFDWAVCEAAIPIVAGNPNVTRLVVGSRLPEIMIKEESRFVEKLRRGNYDTCYIPNHNPKLARLAKHAEIPQRVGLWHSTIDRYLTHPVPMPTAEQHRALLNLALADLGESSLGYERLPLTFYPSDADRKAVMQRLIDQLNWRGEQTLVIIAPGVGLEAQEKAWPIERYVLLGNRIIKNHGAKLILFGEKADQKTAVEVAGMIAGDVANWTGKMGYGELGALAELAHLFIGNDCGASLVAAAMGCKTVTIFGPTQPRVSAPYQREPNHTVALWQESAKRPYSWQDGITVREAETAVRKLLAA